MSEESNEVNSSGENKTMMKLQESASARLLPIQDIKDNTIEKALSARITPLPPIPQGSEDGSADSNDAAVSNDSSEDGSKSSGK